MATTNAIGKDLVPTFFLHERLIVSYFIVRVIFKSFSCSQALSYIVVCGDLWFPMQVYNFTFSSSFSSSGHRFLIFTCSNMINLIHANLLPTQKSIWGNVVTDEKLGLLPHGIVTSPQLKTMLSGNGSTFHCYCCFRIIVNVVKVMT